MPGVSEETASNDGSGDRRPPLAEDGMELLADLDTGDLILFDRPCLKMGGFFGAAICAAAKLMSGSPFDHIGVVVKDENGLNTMVEASFSGVAVRPLSERVRRSSASQICVRRLQVDRTEEMRAEARRFVSEVVHLPYKEGGDGLLQMVSAAFRFHPAKEQRRRVHAETIALSTAIASLEDELAAQPETARDDAVQATKKKRLQRAITRRRKALVFLASAAGGSPAAAAAAASAGPPPSSGAQATPEPPPRKASPSADNSTSSGSSSGSGKGSTSLPSDLSSVASPSPPPSASSPSPSPLSDSSPSSTAPAPPPPTEYDSGLFCSELVAALYQRLGLLDASFPASHDYVPADFATSLGNPIDRVGFDHDGGAGSTAEGQSSEKEATTASAVDDSTASTAQEDERRRRSAAVGETHASPAVLEPPQPPPPVPEGDGRVALLGGASLGPGCWLRGGPPPRPSSPPPPPPSDGESATGNGPHGGGGGGGGNGGTELTPPAAAAYIAEGPIEKASTSGSPWPKQQVAAAGAAAAAAGVLEVVWRLNDEMLVLPLSSSEPLAANYREQRRPWRRRITVGTWWGWRLSPKRLDVGDGPPAEAGVGAGAEACCLGSSGGGGGDCSPLGYCPTLHRSCLRRQTPPPPELTRLGSESSFEPRAGVWRDCLPPPLLQTDRHRSCLPGSRTRRAEGLAFGAEGHRVAWPPAAAAVEASRKARTDADARDGARGDGDRSEKASPAFSPRVAIVTGFAAVAGAAFLAGSRATKPVPVGRRPRLGGSGGGSFAVSTTLAAAAAATAATAAVAASSSSGRSGGHTFPRREAGVA